MNIWGVVNFHVDYSCETDVLEISIPTQYVFVISIWWCWFSFWYILWIIFRLRFRWEIIRASYFIWYFFSIWIKEVLTPTVIKKYDNILEENNIEYFLMSSYDAYIPLDRHIDAFNDLMSDLNQVPTKKIWWISWSGWWRNLIWTEFW